MTLNQSYSCLFKSFWSNARALKRCPSKLVVCTIRGTYTNAPSRKLTKRMEDLTHDNAALKAHLVPQMKGLTNFVEELVNFGISVRISTIS